MGILEALHPSGEHPGPAIAFVLTVPVNRWLISRGKGQAVVHQFHGGYDAQEHRGH